MAALFFVLAHENRRPKWLPTGDLDLSFLSDRWRKLVVEIRDGKTCLVRQQFEVCIFSYLAAELKTGDACVVGSEDYADFQRAVAYLGGVSATTARLRWTNGDGGYGSSVRSAAPNLVDRGSYSYG